MRERCNDPRTLDLWGLTYYVSLNCRYYTKKLAGLVERDYVMQKQYHAENLAEWASLHRKIIEGVLVDESAICSEIESIQKLETEPPDHDLLIESQHDENESHWGKGIRSYEQVMAEKSRREALPA